MRAALRKVIECNLGSSKINNLSGITVDCDDKQTKKRDKNLKPKHAVVKGSILLIMARHSPASDTQTKNTHTEKQHLIFFVY